MEKDIIHAFLRNPFPAWDSASTKALVENRFFEDYHTSQFILEHPDPSPLKKILLCQSGDQVVNIEVPTGSLSNFYNEHGLNPLSEKELESNDTKEKVNAAFEVFKLIVPVHASIISLVRSIQILRQEDPEIDSGYSHPKIPFTIFISVCQDRSVESNLRVAESILHEAMHLKLTLIEQVVPLIVENANGLYFSPWRDEKRPARGVLHGLFVFKAILDFYNEIWKNTIMSNEMGYLNWRIEKVTLEIAQLKEFYLCPDLTEDGASLTRNLLPLS